MQRAKSFEDSNISEFVFTIVPIQATFFNPTQNKLTLVFEKGMQTLGTVKQVIPIIQKSKLTHRFQAPKQKITFRIINDKYLNYHWTVYKDFDGGQMQEIDSIPFSLTNFWKNFSRQFNQQTSELNNKMKKQDQEKKSLLQSWKQITLQGQNRSAPLAVVFKKANFKLDFLIEAKSILDQELQEHQRQKQIKRRRDLERSLMKRSTLTVSAIGQIDKGDDFNLQQRLHRTNTQDQKHLRLPINMLLSPKNSGEGGLKKSVSHAQLISKSKNSDSSPESLNISSKMLTSLKKVSSFQKQNLKVFDREQALQLSSKIKHDHLRSSLQGQKVNKVHSKIKQAIFYIILGVIMIVLMYYLMHPTSHVEYYSKGK